MVNEVYNGVVSYSILCGERHSLLVEDKNEHASISARQSDSEDKADVSGVVEPPNISADTSWLVSVLGRLHSITTGSIHISTSLSSLSPVP